MENAFAKEFIAGLEKTKKQVSSKYFYDDAGSKIFQEIMQMPEYYLTNAEFEIFQLQAKEIIESLNFQEPFHLIELGAGDGSKTIHLIRYLINNGIDFIYTPIDISEEANRIIETKLKEQFPTVKIAPKTGDYFEVLHTYKNSTSPIFLLFIGGNIGNYNKEEAEHLCSLFYANLKKGDKLLLGADLKKNPLLIHQAYQDPHGITKRFNLNLLQRANRELGADFQLDYFDFYCYYNPDNGELKSYIISLRKQSVYFKLVNKTIAFEAGEAIYTELSQKYTLQEIKAIGEEAKFTPKHPFLDCKHYFVDYLFEK